MTFFSHSNYEKSKREVPFLIVLIFKFVNWLMVNDYLTAISYQAFIAKYSYVIHEYAFYWIIRFP